MHPPKQDFSETVDNVDSDEKLLAVIRRHPFGIVRIYFQVFIGVIVAGGLVLSVLPELIARDENPEIYAVIGIIAMVLLGFMVLLLFVATIIYNKSKLVITDKTITQTIQVGLFNRKVSQLAISNVEDVTAQKSGIFPTMLNFGMLLVETAGEQMNFHFDYCPNADHYAKLILDTRQTFMSRQDSMNSAAYQQPYAHQPMNFQQPGQQQAMQQPPQFAHQPMSQPVDPYQQTQQNQQYSQPLPASYQQQYPQQQSMPQQSVPQSNQPYQKPMPQQSGQQPPTLGTDYPEQT